jgi:hypothetical protein
MTGLLSYSISAVLHPIFTRKCAAGVIVNVAHLSCLVLQVKWLLKLSQIPEITEVPLFSEEAQIFLNGIIQDFCIDDAKEVKKIEKITNHDVKAVEYFLKQRCSSNPEIAKV